MATDKPAGHGPNQPQGILEIDRDLYAIESLLRRAQRAHALVSVRLPNSDHTYISSLLEVDTEAKTLKFDELNPAEGHSLLIGSGELHALVRLEGQDVRFKAALIEPLIEDGIAAYRLHYPAKVMHQQRRAYYRARPPFSVRVAVQLFTGDILLATGDLRNISLGGFGAIFEDELPAYLSGSKQLAMLHFPDAPKLTCPIHICHIEKGKQDYQLGAKFLFSDDKTERQVGSIVFGLQRDEMRRKRRTKD